MSPEVWEAQGIVSYYGRKHPLHDPDAFRAGLDGYAMTQGQSTTLVTFANAARGKEPDSHGEGDGLLMHKHPFPGEPAILPQLRPRYAVKTGSKTRHDHAKAFAGNPRGLERHLNDPLSEHEGIDLGGFHVHDNFGKYLVTPAANENYWHDHKRDPAFDGPRGRAKLRAHLRAKHKGRNARGEHKHRRRAHGQNVANRFAAGGELDDLQVIDREAPFSLALHANHDGTIRGTVRGLATILGCRKTAERVKEVLENYVDRGWITADREIKLVEDEWTGALGWGKRDDWPTFTIREDLRYTEKPVRLGDYGGVSIPTPVDAVAEESAYAFLEDGTTDFLSQKHIAYGVERAARRLSLKPGTVRDDEQVTMFRQGYRGVRKRFVRHYKRNGVTTADMAQRLGTSRDTIEKILKEERMATIIERDRIIDRIDRMEARLAETLLSVQQSVNILAERHPDVDFAEWRDEE